MQDDAGASLGQVLTVRSPFFDHQLLPEATVLRALGLYTLCEFDEVERLLADFEAHYQPVQRELERFLASYAGRQGRVLADEAYSAYFERFPEDSVLTAPVFTRFLGNRDLAGLVRHLQLLDQERVRIEGQKARWRQGLGQQLLAQLELDRSRLQRRAGLQLLEEMARLDRELQELLAQSDIIRFEALDALRADFEEKARQPEPQQAVAQAASSYAFDVDDVYWPFNGEFWADELGCYTYVGESDCW